MTSKVNAARILHNALMIRPTSSADYRRTGPIVDEDIVLRADTLAVTALIVPTVAAFRDVTAGRHREF